jgi:hypothetical protein
MNTDEGLAKAMKVYIKIHSNIFVIAYYDDSSLFNKSRRSYYTCTDPRALPLEKVSGLGCITILYFQLTTTKLPSRVRGRIYDTHNINESGADLSLIPYASS